MRVKFWGTRGSLPAPLNATDVRNKLRNALVRAREIDLTSEPIIDTFIDNVLGFSIAGTFGGNTACVEIDAGGDEYVLCDLGTGAREFGHQVLTAPTPGKKKVFNVFMSHLHWDHLMGFPFFTPAYIAGHHIRIHGGHKALEEAFRTQHGAPHFPVDFAQLGARIEFVVLEPSRPHRIAGLDVRMIRQNHGGDSYTYRFDHGGKAVVYSTDAEHKLERRDETDAFVAFLKDADLVIFDAMYSLADMVSMKEDWGHSSNVVGVELCHRAGVRHYCMFHHEPIFDDAALDTILGETRRYEEISDERARPGPMAVSSAYDGLEITV
jgi:phosphoribosyl 1,2-cyclic phosphodiesterase